MDNYGPDTSLPTGQVPLLTRDEIPSYAGISQLVTTINSQHPGIYGIIESDTFEFAVEFIGKC